MNESPGGQGSYYIRNVASGLCLSPAGGSSGLNVIVVQYTCDQDPARYWEFTWATGGYGLVNVKSKLCVSPAGGSTELNVAMVQYTCDNDPARDVDGLHGVPGPEREPRDPVPDHRGRQHGP